MNISVTLCLFFSFYLSINACQCPLTQLNETETNKYDIIFKGKIVEEWLYLINSVSKNKETLLFKRKNNNVEFGEYFKNENEIEFGTKFLKKQLKETETALNTCYLLFDDNFN